MATAKLSNEDRKVVRELVATYESERGKIGLFMNQLLSALRDSSELSPYVHSIKSRMKESDHLRDKLLRKMVFSRSRDEPFEIEPGNLLAKVTDLAGIRILHLYTRQIREIDAVLKEILREQQYGLREGPFARTWDDESRAFFEECGIKTQRSPTLYTSVHYVVESASRTLVTCEIQVRTLMEEVWGEVDHLINYPVPTGSLACREQLKVLARVTSSATRLVDSIFLTSQDHEAPARRRRAVRR
jgi:ppGpp synthetase/RelA/SpoT-type nucleotidyltranferase